MMRCGVELCDTHPALTQHRQVVSVSPTACMSPGLTNETVHLVHGMRIALCPMQAYGTWLNPPHTLHASS